MALVLALGNAGRGVTPWSAPRGLGDPPPEARPQCGGPGQGRAARLSRLPHLGAHLLPPAVEGGSRGGLALLVSVWIAAPFKRLCCMVAPLSFTYPAEEDWELRIG